MKKNMEKEIKIIESTVDLKVETFDILNKYGSEFINCHRLYSLKDYGFVFNKNGYEFEITHLSKSNSWELVVNTFEDNNDPYRVYTFKTLEQLLEELTDLYIFKMESKETILGKYLEDKELSNEFIVTATLCDSYSSMRISTRSPLDLLQFIDTESEYSVSIFYCSEDYMDAHYNLEINGRIKF